MNSLSRHSAEREGGLPKWATALDVVAVLMALIAISVFIGGGFRIWVFEYRISVTDGWRPVILSAIIIAIRHALIRTNPLPQHLAGSLRHWWRSDDRRVVLPIHLTTRVGVLIVAFLAVILVGFPPEATNRWKIYDNDFLDLPARWDTGWYLGIATDGYRYDPNLRKDYQQNIAFFPAFPMAMRYLSVPLGRQPVWTGVAISLAAFYFALTYFLRLARSLLNDEERAVTATTLLAVYPFAVYFSAAYTEALFLLTAVAAVYHFHRNELWRAALWGLLCGLTRPNGAMLSIALALMALRPFSLKRMLIAGSPGYGMLIFSAYIYKLTGNPFTWTTQNIAWGRVYRGLDAIVTDRVDFIAANGLYNYASTQTIDLFYALGVLLCLVAVWPVYRRYGAGLAAFILVIVLPPMAAGGMLSMGRVTSVVFPMFLWLGATIPVRHRHAWITAFAMLQAFVAVMFFTWRPLF